MEEVSVKVPVMYAERMRALAESSGVTLDAIVAAYLEGGAEEHEGAPSLREPLLQRARRYV